MVLDAVCGLVHEKVGNAECWLQLKWIVGEEDTVFGLPFSCASLSLFLVNLRLERQVVYLDDRVSNLHTHITESQPE